MVAGKGLAQARTQLGGSAGTQHHLHRLVPQAALRQRGAIQVQVVVRRADDAVAAKAVTQADGDDAGHQRVLFQCTHGLQRHIAWWHVNV